MKKIDFTLICDGGSDRCLIPILKWVLRHAFSNIPLNGNWADFTRFVCPPRSLVNRIQLTIDLYRPDLLFIHRDAEAKDPGFRFIEIGNAVSELINAHPSYAVPYVCIVPIRMTEAWLLFDETALRKAAGNPNGQVPIDLPSVKSVETIPDPKKLLFELLAEASELHGRHRRRFKPEKCRHLVADYIDDFSPLTALSAFRRLQADIDDLRQRMN
jgi:hypothetical protein